MQAIVSDFFKLTQGILYTDFKDSTNYSLAKSIFADPWYNFVIISKTLETPQIKEAVRYRELNNTEDNKLSFYIDSKLKETNEYFQKNFENIGNDTYLVKRNFKKINIEKNDYNFAKLNAQSLSEYLNACTACFPNWDNALSFANRINTLNKVSDCVAETYLLLDKKEKIVSFGSLICSKDLCYFHYSGTLPEYRRRGLFSLLKKHMLNEALKLGVNNVFAIVEHSQGSFNALSKLGFQAEARYEIYL